MSGTGGLHPPYKTNPLLMDPIPTLLMVWGCLKTQPEPSKPGPFQKGWATGFTPDWGNITPSVKNLEELCCSQHTHLSPNQEQLSPTAN